MKHFTSRSLVWIHPPVSSDWKSLPFDCFSVAYLTWAGGPSLDPNRWVPTAVFHFRITWLVQSEQRPMYDAWLGWGEGPSRKSGVVVRQRNPKSKTTCPPFRVHSYDMTFLAMWYLQLSFDHLKVYETVAFFLQFLCYPTAGDRATFKGNKFIPD